MQNYLLITLYIHTGKKGTAFSKSIPGEERTEMKVPINYLGSAFHSSFMDLSSNA